MHHIAIMKKSWGLISKILTGEKTIESRWYKARFAPWDRIHAGDTVYFKNAGEPVSAVAQVERVLQFENLDREKIEEIIDKYGDAICLVERKYGPCYEGIRYVILVLLKNAKKILPFKIDKTGFGSACAWLVVDDIERIRVKS